MSDYRPVSEDFPPMLMLGYGQASEAAIRAGVAQLAEAVRAAGR
jgi:DNA-binding transcriptional MocR family regulator